jgi:hypothetical protein
LCRTNKFEHHHFSEPGFSVCCTCLP